MVFLFSACKKDAHIPDTWYLAAEISGNKYTKYEYINKRISKELSTRIDNGGFLYRKEYQYAPGKITITSFPPDSTYTFKEYLTIDDRNKILNSTSYSDQTYDTVTYSYDDQETLIRREEHTWSALPWINQTTKVVLYSYPSESICQVSVSVSYITTYSDGTIYASQDDTVYAIVYNTVFFPDPHTIDNQPYTLGKKKYPLLQRDYGVQYDYILDVNNHVTERKIIYPPYFFTDSLLYEYR